VFKHISFLKVVVPCLFAANTLANSITIEQAVNFAVTNHPYIESSRAEREATEGELAVAKRQFLPSITVGAQRGNSNTQQRNLNVQQPLYTFGRLTGQLDLAKSNLDAASAEVVSTEQRIINDTTTRFLELYRAQQNAVVAEENISQHQRLLDIIERRVDAKTSPSVDARLAMARLQYAESEYLQFLNAARASQSALEQLIGEPFNTIVTPSFEVVLLEEIDTLREKVISFSPELVSLEAQVRAQMARVDVSKAEMYPQITANYEKRYGDLLFGQTDEQIFLAVEYQPGAGFSSAANLSAAKARQRSLLSSKRATERELIVQLETLLSQFTMAQNQLQPSEILANSTKDVVESYLRQYVVGRKSWLDVLNAQREASQAMYTLVNNRVLLLQSFYQLKILSGDIRAGRGLQI